MEAFGWENAAPPEVQEFLGKINLPQHGLLLVRLGYNDVNDFASALESE